MCYFPSPRSFSPIPMAAHRGSKDSRNPYEGAELLLGHLEVTAQLPPNTVKGPALPTLLTLEWRARSKWHERFPAFMVNRGLSTKTNNHLHVLGTSQSKRKKHVLTHATVHWFFCRALTSTPAHTKKITVLIKSYITHGSHMVDELVFDWTLFWTHFSHGKLLALICKLQKNPWLPTFENN